MHAKDLKPGDDAYWFNQVSCSNRPVKIIKLTKGRYVIQTDDGQRYSPPRAMVSHKPVDGFPIDRRTG